MIEMILNNNEQWMTMNGQQIFKAAVTTMAAHAEKVAKEAELAMEDIDWFIPHQANLRIIEAVGTRFNIPQEKVIINVDKYANTSSASVPVALDEAIRSGKIKRGDNLLMAAFGADKIATAFIGVFGFAIGAGGSLVHGFVSW
jgi:3-oxoacyl-[acyl-carrier-protein] synthase-3